MVRQGQQEIEEKLSSFREELKSLNNQVPGTSSAENKPAAPVVPNVSAANKKKKIINDNSDLDKPVDEKLSQKQLKVFEYAAQGMSVTDIAKQMNIGQGEVMLILSLKNEVE